jgi:hypothetical protein
VELTTGVAGAAAGAVAAIGASDGEGSGVGTEFTGAAVDDVIAGEAGVIGWTVVAGAEETGAVTGSVTGVVIFADDAAAGG